MQHTKGYVATIVSGKVTYKNGKFTKERPGAVVKSVKDEEKTLEFIN